MALGKIYAALERMFGGRINAQAATSGQVLTKQADGTWAGAAAASGGPTYNSTTDVLGGTPDFISVLRLGNSATASNNVQIDWSGAGALTFYRGDSSAGSTILYGSDQIQLRGAASASGGKLAAVYGGAGTSTGVGGTAGLYGGVSASATGGACQIIGGSPSTAGVGGAVLVQPGAGTGSGNSAGTIDILGASGGGGNSAGSTVNLSSGNSTGSTAGGPFNVTAGNGGATGTGGKLTFQAGHGGVTSGYGGDALIYAGSAQNNNDDGGIVYLSAGGQHGTGRPGQVRLSAAAGSARFGIAKGGDIASANTLTLGADGNFFKITGATTINGIVTRGWQAGSVVHLMFTGAPTVTHNSGAPGTDAVALLLNGASNMSAAANNTLTLVYDGTNWVELARKV